MFDFARAVDKDVIKVDDHELAQERIKHLVHQPYESAWCIR